MSSYTMRLQNVCDYYTREEVEKWFKDYQLTDYLTQEQIQSINENGLWNKDKLARKIVDHYFMREIGAETPLLFKHYAKIEMQEIMEYYLPIIYSNSIKYDMLVNVDFTESFTREIEGSSENNGSSNSSSNNNSSGLAVNSDTPQTNITKQDYLNGSYATNVTANENETNIEDTTETEATSSTNTTETYTKTQKGNSGALTTSQKLIEQYRNIIYAVDKEIIEKLNILFMGIF